MDEKKRRIDASTNGQSDASKRRRACEPPPPLANCEIGKDRERDVNLQMRRPRSRRISPKMEREIDKGERKERIRASGTLLSPEIESLRHHLAGARDASGQRRQILQILMDGGKC